jgi:carbamoyl-phosphate synthase small subunit
MKKGFLLLEDGSSFKGISFGADQEISGEVVFNTGMVGYPEALTDPSYTGQILTFTYPLIGNYGVPSFKKDEFGLAENFESSSMKISGLIVTEYSENHNHWNAKKSLGQWLKDSGVPALTGIDTRALTQKLREKGSMLGKIVTDKKSKLELYDPNKENLPAQASIKKPITYKRGRKKVVVIDCGVKNNIIRSLLKKNVTVIRVPWNYDFIEKNVKCHGVLISNGPGDPLMVEKTVEIVEKAMKKGLPTFGICLGNQILALAAGGKTYKLKFGHRSQNQPCINTKNNRCYITSQNHGYAVKNNSMPSAWLPWFINANDKTVEGIIHRKKPFMAVQFHPEATPGPTDTNYLFDEFVAKL